MTSNNDYTAMYYALQEMGHTAQEAMEMVEEEIHRYGARPQRPREDIEELTQIYEELLAAGQDPADAARMVDDLTMTPQEMAQEYCACVLPWQTCAWCRAAARANGHSSRRYEIDALDDVYPIDHHGRRLP